MVQVDRGTLMVLGLGFPWEGVYVVRGPLQLIVQVDRGTKMVLGLGAPQEGVYVDRGP